MGHDKIMHWLNSTLNIATIEQRRLYNQKVNRNKNFFLHKVGLGGKKLCFYLPEEASWYGTEDAKQTKVAGGYERDVTKKQDKKRRKHAVGFRFIYYGRGEKKTQTQKSV